MIARSNFLVGSVLAITIGCGVFAGTSLINSTPETMPAEMAEQKKFGEIKGKLVRPDGSPGAKVPVVVLGKIELGRGSKNQERSWVFGEDITPELMAQVREQRQKVLVRGISDEEGVFELKRVPVGSWMMEFGQFGHPKGYMKKRAQVKENEVTDIGDLELLVPRR